MKNLIALLLAFALGVYVGRPTKIELSPIQQKIETCPTLPVQTQTAPAITATPQPSPTPSPSVTPSPEASSTDSSSKVQRDDEGEPIDLDKWVTETVKTCAVYIAKYDQDGYKITIDKAHVQALAKLKTSIQAANMHILEEGALNIGDYVYYLAVVSN